MRVLGSLPVRWIPVSNFAVTPVIAVSRRRPALVAQPSEVAAILEPPVAAFLPDAEMITVERDIRGWRVRYAAYPVDGLARVGHDGDGAGQPGRAARGHPATGADRPTFSRSRRIAGRHRGN